MLQPVQTSGTKPPLFFVHGLHGVMPLGRIFAEGLGPDQPLYAVHANGIDVRRPTGCHRDRPRAAGKGPAGRSGDPGGSARDPSSLSEGEPIERSCATANRATTAATFARSAL